MTDLQKQWQIIRGKLLQLGWTSGIVAKELEITAQHLYAHMALGVSGRAEIKAFINWLVKNKIEPDETESIDRWFAGGDDKNEN